MISIKLGLYGAGGLGAEILEIAKKCNMELGRFDEVVYIDDNPQVATMDGYSVVGFDDVCAHEDPSSFEVVVCVGEPRLRGVLAAKVKAAGFRLATLIHPEIEVPDSAVVGEGVIVYRYCNIGPHAQIGANTALLLGANAPHDNRIGENCVLSTNATLSGNCTVGDNAYIAAGAVVKEGVTIGDWAIVGLGSVVFKDVEAETITIGNPAKKVGKNDTHSVFSR